MQDTEEQIVEVAGTYHYHYLKGFSEPEEGGSWPGTL